nr:amino acid ABC transporter permease [uncultured Merdimonas sp.]
MWESFYEQFIVYDGYKLVLQGLMNTMIIALVGLVIGIVIGTIVAVIHVAGTRSRVARVFAYIGDLYTTIFRGTPIVVQLLVFHFVIFPLMRLNIPGVWESVLVFGLNSGAYVAEIMRGGILSVEVGQLEAGRTLGLSFTTTMLKVVFPQAIKNVIPTLGNELIAITKDTSVAGYVGTTDLTVAFRALASNDYQIIIPYLMLALVYLVIVIIFTVIIRIVERRLRKSERRS